LLINGLILGLNVIHCIDVGNATIKYLAGAGIIVTKNIT
jgi:hypothetical protein